MQHSLQAAGRRAAFSTIEHTFSKLVSKVVLWVQLKMNILRETVEASNRETDLGELERRVKTVECQGWQTVTLGLG